MAGAASGVIEIFEGNGSLDQMSVSYFWSGGFTFGQAVVDQAVGGDEHIDMAGVTLDAGGVDGDRPRRLCVLQRSPPFRALGGAQSQASRPSHHLARGRAPKERRHQIG